MNEFDDDGTGYYFITMNTLESGDETDTIDLFYRYLSEHGVSFYRLADELYEKFNRRHVFTITEGDDPVKITVKLKHFKVRATYEEMKRLVYCMFKYLDGEEDDGRYVCFLPDWLPIEWRRMINSVD